MRLADKVILVTGAASGMGRVAMRMFAEQGARVIATDIDEQALALAVAEVDLNDKVMSVVGDVARSEDVERMVTEGVARFGTLTTIYNNAGIMPNEDTSVVENDEDVWQQVLDVNLKSIFLVCKHGIPHMIEGGGGSIINIASFVALVGCSVPQDAYTASKGAVLSLTRSVAVQYGPQGVRANVICPGPILTPMMETLFASEEEKMKRLNRIPLGRFGRAEDIVWAGVFLASDESTWMTGSQFVVDGGITVNYF